jgi:hypothetical protein
MHLFITIVGSLNLNGRKKSKDAAAMTAGSTKIAVLLNGQNRAVLKMFLNVQWIGKE